MSAVSTSPRLRFITEKERGLEASARLVGDPVALAAAEAALAALAPRLRAERGVLARAIAGLMPAEPVLAPPLVAQAGRNARARAELLSDTPMLSAAEVAERAGSRARNRAALAARWRAEGRIFGLPVGARILFPAFQFGPEGRPLPALADVIAETVRRLGMGPWALALWLRGPSSALDGRSPLELLGSEPERVRAAAAALGSEGAW